MEDYFAKLDTTDQMNCQELNELFNFFSPLIEKVPGSNNFTFVCTEPNFQSISLKSFDVDSILAATSSSLLKFNGAVEAISQILGQEAHPQNSFQGSVGKNSKSHLPQRQPSSSNNKNALTNHLQFQPT